MRTTLAASPAFCLLARTLGVKMRQLTEVVDCYDTVAYEYRKAHLYSFRWLSQTFKFMFLWLLLFHYNIKKCLTPPASYFSVYTRIPVISFVCWLHPILSHPNAANCQSHGVNLSRPFHQLRCCSSTNCAFKAFTSNCSCRARVVSLSR